MTLLLLVILWYFISWKMHKKSDDFFFLNNLPQFKQKLLKTLCKLTYLTVSFCMNQLNGMKYRWEVLKFMSPHQLTSIAWNPTIPKIWNVYNFSLNINTRIVWLIIWGHHHLLNPNLNINKFIQYNCWCKCLKT